MYESPGDGVRVQILIQIWEEGLRFCLSYKLPRVVSATGPQTHILSKLLSHQQAFISTSVSLPTFPVLVNGVTIRTVTQLETWTSNSLLFTPPSNPTSNPTYCQVLFVS